MITCPHCKSESCSCLRRSVTNPAHDEFQCRDCGQKFYRYEKTPLEKEGDPKHGVAHLRNKLLHWVKTGDFEGGR